MWHRSSRHLFPKASAFNLVKRIADANFDAFQLNNFIVISDADDATPAASGFVLLIVEVIVVILNGADGYLG